MSLDISAFLPSSWGGERPYVAPTAPPRTELAVFVEDPPAKKRKPPRPRGRKGRSRVVSRAMVARVFDSLATVACATTFEIVMRIGDTRHALVAMALKQLEADGVVERIERRTAAAGSPFVWRVKR